MTPRRTKKVVASRIVGVALGAMLASGCAFFDSTEDDSADSPGDAGAPEGDGDDAPIAGDGDQGAGGSVDPAGAGGGAGATGGSSPITGGAGGAVTNTGLTEADRIKHLQRFLRINEIFHSLGGFVELYNAGADPLDLSDVYLAPDEEEFGALCPLDGELPAGGFLVVQQAEGECLLEAPNCITGCELNIAGDEVLAVYTGTPYELIDAQSYPPSDQLPVGGYSYQASEDGGEDFSKRQVTAGYSNE